jgi:hypothetical protein
MATITSSSYPRKMNLIIRSTLIGGLTTGVLHMVTQVGIVFGILLGNPFISSLQYVASGAMGNAAFAGGLATALLGLILEFLMTTIIAGIFMVSAARIPFLRRYVIPGSLLYGFGVFIVMNFVVLPLSAAPPLPAPSMLLLLEIILEHILFIGLPLGIILQWNANRQK